MEMSKSIIANSLKHNLFGQRSWNILQGIERGGKIMSEKLSVKYTDIVDCKTGKVVRTTKQSYIPDDDQRMDEDATRLEKLGRFELRRATKDED